MTNFKIFREVTKQIAESQIPSRERNLFFFENYLDRPLWNTFPKGKRFKQNKLIFKNNLSKEHEQPFAVSSLKSRRQEQRNRMQKMEMRVNYPGRLQRQHLGMQVQNWEVKSQWNLKIARDTQVSKKGFCKFIS